MANKPNQAVTAPATSAVGSAVEMICGRSLVDAEASIRDIGFSTQKVESGIGDLVADREVLDSNLLHWVVQSGADGKLLRHAKDHELAPNKFVPVSYPEFMKVREFYVGAAFDAGAESLEGAEKVWERAVQRLVKLTLCARSRRARMPSAWRLSGRKRSRSTRTSQTATCSS